LFFEGEGKIKEFVGGYADIYQWYAANAVSKKGNKAETSKQSESPKTKPKTVPSKKLSYKQQLELEKLPISIDKLEREIAQLQSLISDGDFFKQDNDSTSKTLAQLADAESSLSEAYARWDELEALTE
jgi:ATP-binding cassette subfamily F protein uup